MASPFVYLPGAVLSRAELLSACLDGHLVPLGEGPDEAPPAITTPVQLSTQPARDGG